LLLSARIPLPFLKMWGYEEAQENAEAVEENVEGNVEGNIEEQGNEEGEWSASMSKGMGKGKKGKMWEMFSMMMYMKGKGKGMMGGGCGGSGGSGGRGPTSFAWKSELVKAYSKTHKEQLTKESLLYSSTKNDGVYSCALTSSKFESTYSGEGRNEKAAQEAAAEAALRAEFPDFVEGAEALLEEFQNPSQAYWGGASAMTAQQGCSTWRAQLSNAYARMHKGTTKDCIKYETETIEASGRRSAYRSTVSSDEFESQYTGDQCTSKKFAEDSAAMVAMEAEFPEDFEYAQMPKTEKAFKKAKKKQQGEKRSLEGQQMDPKSKLNNAMSLLSPQQITKAMIEYETKDEEGSTIATVTINCFGTPQVFSGETEPGTSKESKKRAETSAAEAAFAHFEEQYTAAKEEHEAKKKEKDDQKKTEWQAMLARKKEEKAAQSLEKAKKTALESAGQ